MIGNRSNRPEPNETSSTDGWREIFANAFLELQLPGQSVERILDRLERDQ